MPGLIALLTDFGWQDSYVGVMKGVMLQINPALRLVDLTHAIPPQDVAAGRFNLLSSYRFFPEDTVFLAVVDPGVGTYRRAVAVQCAHGFLVGPDNGLLSGVLQECPAISAVELNQPDYWRTLRPSTTFHGRDIFAPVAAHLASGVRLAQLGRRLDPTTLSQLEVLSWAQSCREITGAVQYIDQFGNLITTIPEKALKRGQWQIWISGILVELMATYGHVASGLPMALVGSHGYLEIAINGGSAQAYFQVKVGEPIHLKALSPPLET